MAFVTITISWFEPNAGLAHRNDLAAYTPGTPCPCCEQIEFVDHQTTRTEEGEVFRARCWWCDWELRRVREERT